MVARVNVPGLGPMYFPESMSNEDITAKVDATLESMKGLRRPEMDSGRAPPMEGMSSARREVLDTIAGTESPDYNTLYGGRKIADLSRHPGIDVPIMSGPNVGKTSSAFGRYQFLEPTWKEQAKKLGLKDMSPASQDAAAWNLASETYQNKTGRNLEEDWASGDPAMRQSALRALSGVWTSLPGGIEQNAKYGRGRILDPKDLPTSELVKGGFKRGMTGLEGTALDLIPALAGSLFGNDDYAKQQLGEYNQRMADIQELYPTAYESFKDIGSIGQAFDYAAETLGETGPDMVAFLTGSGIGSFAGRKLAKRALADEIKDYAAKQGLETAAAEEAFSNRLMDKALVGSWVGSGGVSAGLNIPETFNQIYQDTGELHPGIAASLGGAKAMLDTIVPQKIWGQLTNAERSALTAKIGEKIDVVPTSWKKAFALETGQLMAAEGLTEGAQTAIDNLASKIAGSSKDLMDNVFDSAIRGAIGGGAFGAPGAALQASRDARAQEPTPPQELTGITDQRERLMLPSPDQADAQFRSQFNAPGTPQQVDMWGASDIPLERYYEQTQGVDPRALDYPQVTEWQGGEHPYEKFGGVRPTSLDTGPVAPAQAPSTVIDEGVLKGMGLGPRAGIYKKLLGKDLSNEEDRAAVAEVEKGIKSNSKLTKDQKTEISRIIRGLTPTGEQQELGGEFAPKFEDYGPGSFAEHSRQYREGKAAADFFNLRAATPGLGVGPQLPSGPRTGVPAAGAGVSETGGMAADTSGVSGPAGRTAGEQRALEAEQIAKKQQIRQLQGVSEQATKADVDARQQAVESIRQLEGEQIDTGRQIRQLKEVATQAIQEGDTDTHREAVQLVKQLEAKRTDINQKIGQLREVAEQATTADVDTRQQAAQLAKQLEGAEAKKTKTLPSEDIQDPADQQAVVSLKGNKAPKGDAKSAQSYFNQMPTLQQGLASIANDLVYPTPRHRTAPDVEGVESGERYKGTGGQAAKSAANWVQKNLGAEANAELDRLVAENQKQKEKTDAMDKTRWSKDDLTERNEFGELEPGAPSVMGGTSGNLDLYDKQEAKRAESAPVQVLTRVEGESASAATNEVSKLAKVLSPEVVSALRKGNLRQALTIHGAKIGGVAEKIARILAKNIGDTKVVVSLGLANEMGKPVAGYFDPKTNTIHLDATTGLNSHVLIHEAVHPVMSHVLADPNNPLTRNLTQLFDKVKDSLGSAYGATDVQEFAAEAWGNPELANILQSINPDGAPHTAWDRFVRAISNFFRRMAGLPPKSLASAYDKVDALLSAIASPAPQHRDASILYAPTKGSKFAIGMTDRIIDAVPFLGEQQKSALSEAIGAGSDVVSNGIFSLLPLNSLTDLAEKYFPDMARKISDLVNQRGGYEKKINRMIDPIVHLAKQAIKTAGQQQQRYDDLVHESTIKMVDPTRPRDYYKDDADKQKVWDELNTRYKSLNPVWQNLYVRMRDAYKGMYDEIRSSIDDRIDNTDISKETKTKIKADIMKEMSKKGLIDPYFALGRQGDLWLSAPTRDKNGQVDFTVEAFKSTFARQKRIEQLIAEGTDPESINTYANVNEVDYRRAPAGSFVNSVFHLMKTNGVSDKAVDEMMRLFIATLPETAFAKSMQARKGGGRSGYDKDSIGVFERKMRGMAHQVSNLRYNPKIRGALDNMREYATEYGKTKGDNSTHVKYLDEFEKHLRYVLNPTKNDLGSILSSTAFHYTLGFNLSSALVNLANVPMIVAPYLMGKYSDASVSRALGDATKVFMASGRKAEIEMMGANGEKVMMDVMPSIANYDPKSAIGRKFATLVRIASENGQLDRSQLYEMIRGDTRTGPMAKFNALSGWAFHHGERMNREVTMMATYDLEMQRLQKAIQDGKISQAMAEVKAAEEAVRTVELTNGSIAAAAAPRIAQSSIGKLLFMYKRYGVSMYYMLFKTFKQAIDKSLPEAERKAAWKQLGGIYGMSALMAGVQGLPLFGAASMVYALFSDDDDDDLGTATRKYIGDFAYKGPIEAMTNLAIAGRISLNDLIVRDTKQGSEAMTFSQQIAQAMGGPALGIADRMQRGLSKISEGHIERGVEDMLPAFMANMLKATRYASQGTQTLRGDPITGDVNPWNIAAQALGFAPADYTRQLEMNDRMKGMHDQAVKDASNLKRRYYVASRVGDYDGMEDAKQELLELGAKHPGLEINPATIRASIEKSVKAQKAATKDMRHGVRYSKKMLQEIKQEEREWDGEDEE